MSELEHLEECGICHALHPLEELRSFDDALLCPDCLEDSTVICGRCGERLWRDDDQGNEDSGPLCQSCYNRYYGTCEHCGHILPEEDLYMEENDEMLCYDCHRRHRSRYSINDYSYKPDPIFYGSDTLFMGVELEIDEGGESDNQARKLLEIANAESERIYCKHDGSLNDGFEVVSHPMTLEYHTKTMPWQAVLEKAKQLDYRSHQAKTCGLHVHVNRTAFGDDVAEQDEVIARILYFVEKHWDELRVASRRTAKQYAQWCNRIGYHHEPKDLLDTAKKNYKSFRYVAVNLCNTDTVEFRLFRGTLRYNTFIATLQLVQRICDVAICLSDEEVQNMSWSTFVAGCVQYPELALYLKERRIFVNDPVTAEAEV